MVPIGLNPWTAVLLNPLSPPQSSSIHFCDNFNSPLKGNKGLHQGKEIVFFPLMD